MYLLYTSKLKKKIVLMRQIAVNTPPMCIKTFKTSGTLKL